MASWIHDIALFRSQDEKFFHLLLPTSHRNTNQKLREFPQKSVKIEDSGEFFSDISNLLPTTI